MSATVNGRAFFNFGGNTKKTLDRERLAEKSRWMEGEYGPLMVQLAKALGRLAHHDDHDGLLWMQMHLEDIFATAVAVVEERTEQAKAGGGGSNH